MCPHTAALACVDQINKNVSSVFFFIFLGTWCLKNGISSRQDALHIAWICGKGLLLSVLILLILLLSMETEFVGMDQSQSRHFGAKERHSLCAQQ